MRKVSPTDINASPDERFFALMDYARELGKVVDTLKTLTGKGFPSSTVVDIEDACDELRSAIQSVNNLAKKEAFDHMERVWGWHRTGQITDEFVQSMISPERDPEE